MVEVVVSSAILTLGAVHVLGEVREILQSVMHVPHKHEDLDPISNPYGKSGIGVIAVSWQSQCWEETLDPWDSVASQSSINNKTQVLRRDPDSKSKVDLSP